MRIKGPLLPLTTMTLCLAACSADGGREARTRTTTSSSEWSVGGLVSGRSETSVTEPIDEARNEEARNESVSAQAERLTAGDYDDLLNPDLYADYAGRFLQVADTQLPFVDTRSRVTVRVVDAQGRPVPQARVDVRRSGAPLRLVAGADGIASFYPAFDRIGTQTQIDIASAAGTASRTVRLGAQDGRTITIGLPGAARPTDALDLVLAIDTTGSMGDEIAYLQSELDGILARLRRESGNLDLRIGLILYRDEGDAYVTRAFPLSADAGLMRARLFEQSAGGGGDMPEAMDRALLEAERMQWRPQAAKAMLLIGDAPPHREALEATLAATQRLRAQGVRIVPVAASGVEDSTQYMMRTMAALTQGRYIFLTDDSGIGDPHAEPDVACYVVTRLDQLIARVLAGIVAGRRIEPAQGEVIRAVGDYDAGRCRTPQLAMN